MTFVNQHVYIQQRNASEIVVLYKFYSMGHDVNSH